MLQSQLLKDIKEKVVRCCQHLSCWLQSLCPSWNGRPSEARNKPLVALTLAVKTRRTKKVCIFPLNGGIWLGIIEWHSQGIIGWRWLTSCLVIWKGV